jgi:hypothetical protein
MNTNHCGQDGIEELRRQLDLVTGALRTAYKTLDRDGDEWGLCDQLRAALAAVRNPDRSSDWSAKVLGVA